MITNINEFKRSLMENNSNDLIKGTLYKIYDKLKNNTIMYSQAKYLGENKFELINMKGEIISLDNFDNYIFTETRDFTTVKK